MSRAFEDFPIGTCLVSTSCPITVEAIVDFGREFDPQVFHLDPRLAEKTLFGGLAASGWQTAAISMRLFVDTMNVRGGIIGLEVDALKWPNPARPGDELRAEIRITKARRSKSRPGYGIIRVRVVTKNQCDEVVQSFMTSAMLPARGS